MKGILLSTFIILFRLTSLSQVYHFKSHSVTVSIGKPVAKSFKKEISIVIDMTHKLIIISGEMKKKYKIISTDTSYIDLTNSQNLYWKGIDQEGMKCRIGCIIYSKELQTPRNTIWGSLTIDNVRKLYSYNLNPK